MSRVGKAIIPVPKGVKYTLTGLSLTVEGPKGKLAREIPAGIGLEMTDDGLSIVKEEGTREAIHGLTRALVANMVHGVSEGFQKVLQIVGVGYRAELKGKALELNVGYSHPVVVEPPEGIDFKVENPTRIVVEGIDREKVGRTSADIRKVRKPEPYKGKGIKYEEENIRRKAGKAAV